MHKPSFLAGLLAGGGASVLVVAAVPGIVPGSGPTEPRAPGHVVVLRDETPMPPRAAEGASTPLTSGPGRPEAAGTDAIEAGFDLAAARRASNRTAAIA